MLSLSIQRACRLNLPGTRARVGVFTGVVRLLTLGEHKWDIEVVSDQPHKLVNKLHSVWAPYAMCEEFMPGTITCADPPLFASEHLKSSVHFIEPKEIAELQAARLIRPTIKGVTEVNPDLLDEFTLRTITYSCHFHSFAPWLNIELRPNSLTIDTSGGASFTHERSSDDFIGTLIANFNVDYTGGAIEVTYKGQTTVFEQKQCWVAVHKDCSYTIKPITSGSRIDMVFDIYSFDRYAAFDAVNYGTMHPRYCLDISTDMGNGIIDALRAEFTQYNTVVVNLAGHYATSNSNHVTNQCNKNSSPAYILPEHLTGADRALHTLLNEHFNVLLQPVELKCTVDEDTNRIAVTSANFLEPTNFASTSTTTYHLPTHVTNTNTTNTYHVTNTNTTNTYTSSNTKIVLPNRLHRDNLVSSTPTNIPGVNDDEDSSSLTELVYHTVALVVKQRT